MERVIIGVDPRKLSVTIEARDSREVLRATGRFETSTAGHRELLAAARQWPERVWAVEGANGIGRPVAQRLLAGGERVLDVPAKLAARARVSGSGQGRKTDATDAHAIVMVALRDPGLRELSADADLMMLRMLCDRRDEISRARAQALNRMHRLFLELLPGGAPVKKTRRAVQGPAGQGAPAGPGRQDAPPDGRRGTSRPGTAGRQAQGHEGRAQGSGGSAGEFRTHLPTSSGPTCGSWRA
jgi:transposase